MLKEGEFAGKIAVVLDVVDLNRILIQGPQVPRQAFLIRNTNLTRIVIDMPRGSRTKTMMKYWTAADVDAKFAATNAAKKLVRSAIRKNSTDFDRFKLMLAQKKKAHILRA